MKAKINFPYSFLAIIDVADVTTIMDILDRSHVCKSSWDSQANTHILSAVPMNSVLDTYISVDFISDIAMKQILFQGKLEGENAED